MYQYASILQYGNRREVPIKLSPLLQRHTRTSSSESTPLLLLSPSGGGRAWARTPSLLSAVFSTLVPSLSWQIDHFSFLKQDVSFPVQQCVRKNDHFAKTGSGQTYEKRIFSAFYIYSHRIVSSTDSFIGGPPCCRPEAAAFVVRELVLVQAQPRRVPPSSSSSAAAAVSKVCVAQRRSRGGCGRVPPPPMLLLVAAAAGGADRFIGGACRRARL